MNKKTKQKHARENALLYSPTVTLKLILHLSQTQTGSHFINGCLATTNLVAALKRTEVIWVASCLAVGNWGKSLRAQNTHNLVT